MEYLGLDQTAGRCGMEALFELTRNSYSSLDGNRQPRIEDQIKQSKRPRAPCQVELQRYGVSQVLPFKIPQHCLPTYLLSAQPRYLYSTQ